MPRKPFSTPYFTGTDSSRKKFTVDVTSSIAPSLLPNKGLITTVTDWMKAHHFRRVLDFGAGALRHTLPLLRAGFEVTAVEYEQAFNRSVAIKNLTQARRFKSRFVELIWPQDFIEADEHYDVVLLVYVLQTIPEKAERDRILQEIAKKLDPDGPRRMYYASRINDRAETDAKHVYRDGWIRKIGNNYQTFYTEWKSGATEKLMKRRGFERAGNYEGAQQPFIFELFPGKM